MPRRAPKAASGPESVPDGRERTRVFISYSRKDETEVLKLADLLAVDETTEVFRDKEDILPSEEWRARIESLIGQADNFLFFISPHSLGSEVCAWELEAAVARGKRIVAALLADAPGANVPPALARTNFILLRAGDPLDEGVERLRFALRSDIAWIREHTRIGELAERWNRDGRRAGDLMRGPALEAAERWIASQPREAPSPTETHRTYIVTGRREAVRRQRNWVIGSLLVAAMAIGLSIVAYLQRNEAVAQRTDANARRLTAEAQAALSNVLGDPEVPAQNLLVSLKLKRSAEAHDALMTAVNRLEPVRIGTLPWPESGPVALGRLVFSSDGAWIAGVGSNDLLVWHAKTRALRVRHRIDEGKARPVLLFSGDARHVVVVSDAKDSAKTRIVVADLNDGKVTEHQLGAVLDAATIDGRPLALVAAPSGSQVRVVEIVTGRQVWEATTKARPRLGRLIPPAVKPGNAPSMGSPQAQPPQAAAQLVLAIDDGSVESWRFDAAEPLAIVQLPAGSVVDAFGDTGGVMAVRSAAGDVAILDTVKGNERWRAPPDSKGARVAFAGADRFVLARGASGPLVQSIAGDLSVNVEHPRRADFDASAMEDVTRYSSIISVDTTSDGTMLASAWKDGRIDIWRQGLKPRFGASDAMPRANFESVARFDHGEELGNTATWQTPAPPLFVSPTGRYVASQSMGVETNAVGGIVRIHPVVRIWDTRAGGETARWRRPGGMLVMFSPMEDVAITLSSPGAKAPPLLELWTLTQPQPEVRRDTSEYEATASDKREMGQDPRAAMLAGAAAAPVWVGVDRKLRMLDESARRVVVLDDLASAADAAAAEMREEVKRLLPKLSEEERSLAQAIDPDEHMQKSIAEQLQKLAPETPVPLYPVAVSGDRKRAAVQLGSTLRVYSLEQRSLIGSTRLPDTVIVDLGAPVSVRIPVMSHAGKAIAVAYMTLAEAARLRALSSAASRSSRKKEGADGPISARQQVVVYSVESRTWQAQREEPVEMLAMTPMGPVILANKPIAVSDDASLLAVEHSRAAGAAGGPPEFNRRVIVMNAKDRRIRFETRPSAPMSPLDQWNMSSALPPAAAFSGDGRRIVIDETRSACPPMLKVLPSLLPVNAPSCPDRRTTLTLWDTDRGSQLRELSYEWLPASPEPSGPQADMALVMGVPQRPRALALLGDATVERTVFERKWPAGEGGAKWQMTTDRTALDQSEVLPAYACSRLPAKLRTIADDIWQRRLPGEKHRQFCGREAQ